jgi:hypothetical protein
VAAFSAVVKAATNRGALSASIRVGDWASALCNDPDGSLLKQSLASKVGFAIAPCFEFKKALSYPRRSREASALRSCSQGSGRLQAVSMHLKEFLLSGPLFAEHKGRYDASPIVTSGLVWHLRIRKRPVLIVRCGGPTKSCA